MKCMAVARRRRIRPESALNRLTNQEVRFRITFVAFSFLIGLRDCEGGSRRFLLQKSTESWPIKCLRHPMVGWHSKTGQRGLHGMMNRQIRFAMTGLVVHHQLLYITPSPHSHPLLNDEVP